MSKYVTTLLILNTSIDVTDQFQLGTLWTASIVKEVKIIKCKQDTEFPILCNVN